MAYIPSPLLYIKVRFFDQPPPTTQFIYSSPFPKSTPKIPISKFHNFLTQNTPKTPNSKNPLFITFSLYKTITKSTPPLTPNEFLLRIIYQPYLNHIPSISNYIPTVYPNSHLNYISNYTSNHTLTTLLTTF